MYFRHCYQRQLWRGKICYKRPYLYFGIFIYSYKNSGEFISVQEGAPQPRFLGLSSPHRFGVTPCGFSNRGTWRLSAAKSKETPRTLSSLVHINAPFSSKWERRGCSAATLTFSHFRFWPYTLNLVDRKRHSDPMAARKRDKQGQFVDFPVFSSFPIAMHYPSKRFGFHALLCNIHCNLVVSDQEFSSPFLARNARSFVTADEYRSDGGCCLCVWFYSL